MNRGNTNSPKKKTLFDYFKSPKKSMSPASPLTVRSRVQIVSKESK